MQKEACKTSVAEYLDREERSPVRHEYVDGEVHAMVGASRRHNLLVTKLLKHAAIAADRKEGCEVFSGSMKVHVAARNSFYYPDLSVCCDPQDREELYLTRPCLLIEVLSPSTAGVDRREKRLSYATLQSLCEYVIVEQDRMRVTVYPSAGGPWLVRILNEPEDTLELSCLDLRLTLREIYAGVDLPAPGTLEPEAPAYEVLQDSASG